MTEPVQNALNWFDIPVADLDRATAFYNAILDETLERYDGMDQDERWIFRGGGPYIAWFTDPAGNVLSVIQQ